VGFWRDFWAALAGRVDDNCFEDEHDDVLSNIQVDAAATRQAVNTAIRKIDQLQKDVQIMAEREDQAWATFNSKVEVIKQGWAAKDAEILNLRAQLVAAGADTANQVQAALDADSAVDATKVEAANVVLDELVVPPATPEPEPEEPAEPEGNDEPRPDDAA
jgi:hypothetical protein